MRYLKYEFSDKNAFDTLVSNRLLDDDGNLLNGIDIVELGDIVKTPAVYDENEELITPAVMTGKWAVDIIWSIEPPAPFEQLERYPKGQVYHTFAGQEHLYKKELYRKYPELKPE